MAVLGNKITLADNVAVSGTGVVGVAQTNLPADADDIALIVKVESGTVAALVVELEENIEGTWVQVGSVQTANTSGAAMSIAAVVTTGKLRVNATTVTTPSSLEISAHVVYSKKFD
jgi:hypothetical protein